MEIHSTTEPRAGATEQRADEQPAPYQCEYTRWGKHCKCQALAWHAGHIYCAHHWRVMRGGG